MNEPFSRSSPIASAQEPAQYYSPLLRLAQSGSLPLSGLHDCPYLPGRMAEEEGFYVDRLDAQTYHELMDVGFRRSGRVFYRPRCQGCRACTPLRIPVDDFRPSRSQRRVVRRNNDIIARAAKPQLTAEKHRLYQRYLHSRHPGSPQSDDFDGLEDFLYTTCVDTLEICYYAGGQKLIGVSIADLSRRSVSTVYHYFDPDESRRRMGVYSVLAEIELCRQWGVPYYYMGFWVPGARTMQYKAQYLPHEVLVEGQWVRRSQRQP